jgi:PAS domain S-box-containing protein
MGAADAEPERTQHAHPAEDRDREAVLGGDLLETAFALAPVGLALIGLDGRFIRANRGACRILGWPESELRGRSLHDITVPEDRLCAVAEIRQLLAGERDECRAVKRVHDSQGEPVAVMLSVAVARDTGGTPRHFVVVLEDACSDRAAELPPPAGTAGPPAVDAAPAIEPDHARAIVSAIPEGYALTIGTEIRAVNDALCTLTGFTPEQLIGVRPPYPFWPPELAGVNEELRRTITDQQGERSS